MNSKKVLYTSLLAASLLAVAPFAHVSADDSTTDVNPDPALVRFPDEDVTEVKVNIIATRDTSNNIVFQITPETENVLNKNFVLKNIRASYLDNGTPVLGTSEQVMAFEKNTDGVFEKVWKLRLSGNEKRPYSLDENLRNSRKGNYRFEINEVIEQNGQKYRLVGSVDFGMNDTFQYAPLTKTETPAKTETSIVERTEVIPFIRVEVKDDSLKKGETKVKTAGVNGEKTVKVRQTLVDGKVTQEEVVEETTTKEPVDEVVLVGTKEETSVTPSSEANPPKQDPSKQGRDQVLPPQNQQGKEKKQETSSSSSETKIESKFKKNLPNTGEQTSIVVAVVGAILASIAFLVFKKSKVGK